MKFLLARNSCHSDVRFSLITWQGLLQHFEVMRDTFSKTNENVQDIQNKISNDSKNVQKVSLLCFCKQEITLISGRVQENIDQILEIIRECDKSIKEKLYLDS